MAKDSPTRGDWVIWVGAFYDIAGGGPGQFRARLKDNRQRDDCAYAGLECLPDNAFVATTYGHWAMDEQPYILSVGFALADLDERLKAAR